MRVLFLKITNFQEYPRILLCSSQVNLLGFSEYSIHLEVWHVNSEDDKVDCGISLDVLGFSAR